MAICHSSFGCSYFTGAVYSPALSNVLNIALSSKFLGQPDIFPISRLEVYFGSPTQSLSDRFEQTIFSNAIRNSSNQLLRIFPISVSLKFWNLFIAAFRFKKGFVIEPSIKTIS